MADGDHIENLCSAISVRCCPINAKFGTWKHYKLFISG